MSAPYLPVTLNGQDLLIDPPEADTLPVVREQADTSSQPGEQSLNPRGLWRRSQESWHHGAGQSFLDSMEDRDPYRFRNSKGIDPWTRGELSLLNETYRIWPSANTNLQMVVTGQLTTTALLGIIVSTAYVYLADGDSLLVLQSVPGRTANYLTNDQFSAEVAAATGVAAAVNCSVARSTTVAGAGGSAASWRLSSTAGGDMSATTPTGVSGVPVLPGEAVGASAYSRAGTTVRNVRVKITFYTAAGAVISTTTGSSVANVTGSWSVIASVTATAPANAAFMSWTGEVLATGGAAELHYFDWLTLGPYSGSGTPSTAPFIDFNIHNGEAAQAVNSITTDGNYVWAALGTSGIHRALNAVPTNNVPGPLGANHFTHLVGYANGRLLAAGSPAAGGSTLRNVLYEVTSPIAAPAFSILRTHDSTAFVWKGISPGRNCIYAWGDSGGTSEIYRITIEPTGVNLGAPVSATQMPDGEQVHSLVYYAGGVVMGTNKGVRCGVVDGQGNIDYGPHIPGAPVKALEPQGRHCWYSLWNYDASSTGLGRLDLGHFTEPLVPAWASDLMAGDATNVVQGDVISIITYPGSVRSEERRLFAVSGKGIWAEPVDISSTSTTFPYTSPSRKVATGTLETGAIRWSTSVPKTLRRLELRHHALPAGASVSVERKLDDGAYSSVGSSSTTGSSGTTLSPTGSGESAELRITLNRATDPLDGAELVRYTLKALATPGRTRAWILPIILKPRIEDANGQTTPQQVDTLYAAIEALETSGEVVTLTIGSDSYEVYVDQKEFQPEVLWREEPGNYYYIGRLNVRVSAADV